MAIGRYCGVYVADSAWIVLEHVLVRVAGIVHPVRRVRLTAM